MRGRGSHFDECAGGKARIRSEIRSGSHLGRPVVAAAQHEDAETLIVREQVCGVARAAVEHLGARSERHALVRPGTRVEQREVVEVAL